MLVGGLDDGRVLPFVHQGAQEAVLAAADGVDGGGSDAGAGGDVLDGGGEEALGREQRARGVDDGLAGERGVVGAPSAGALGSGHTDTIYALLFRVLLSLKEDYSFYQSNALIV